MRELLEPDKAPVDLAIERTPGIGCLDTAAVAREQREPGRFLQFCDQPADARLRRAELLGGSGHRSPQHHQPELLDLSLIHPPVRSFSFPWVSTTTSMPYQK